MAVNVNIFTYAMNPPGPPFSASDDDKLNWPEVSVSSVDLNDYPWHHEVLGAIVNMTGEWHQTAHTNTNFRAFNDATNELLFEMDILLPPNKPDETYIGVEQKFWIGRADWEIKGPMKVRMEVSTTGGQVPSVSKTLFMDVIDTGLPPDEVLEDGNIIIHAKKVGMNPDLIVVDFITDPPGADISIQGHGRGTSPFYTFFLGSLPRRVIITKEGFERFEFVIPSRFIGYEIDVNATLRPIVPVETGNLKVTVLEPGGSPIQNAVVTLHPGNIGNPLIATATTNASGVAEINDIDAGHYEISTAAAGFETKVTAFDIVKGELTSLIVVLELVVPEQSTYDFISIPLGATIFVDGTNVGTTPVSVTKDILSPHEVRATLPGLKEFSQTLLWPESGTKTFTITLEGLSIINASVTPSPVPADTEFTISVDINNPTDSTIPIDINLRGRALTDERIWPFVSTTTNIRGNTTKPVSSRIIGNFPPPDVYDLLVTVNRAGTTDVLAERTFERLFEVVTEEPPWWRRLLDVISQEVRDRFLSAPPFFRAGFVAATGREPTEEEINRISAEIADFVIPLNALTKLIIGKNLKGEAEEFGSSEDWLDIILSAAILIPAGKVATTAERLSARTITKAEATKLTAELGKATVVENLIVRMRNAPVASSAFLRKFPRDVRIAVIDGLVKTTQGRSALATLGRIRTWRLTAPWYQKIIGGIFVFAAMEQIVFQPIFAATEIPQYFNMRIFARDSLAAQAGLDPTTVNIDFNDLDSKFESLMFDMRRALDAGDKTLAREILDDMLKIRNAFDTLITQKRSVLEQTGGLELEQLNLEHMTAILLRAEQELEVTAEVGTITVTANVSDANVWRNGEFVGRTTYEAEWAEGTYTVLVSKDGYESDQMEVTIDKDVPVVFNAVLTLISQVGQIIVTSNPEKDATIYLDDQPQTRKTDTTLFNVPLGLHKVRIFKEPFGNVEYIAEPDEISVNLLGIDQVERADFVLTAREIPPETGGIAVTSLPSGATIWLNDIQQQFPTNTVIKELTPGTYRVKIHKDGYEDPLERTIEVKAGAIESADFGALTILPAAKGTLVIDVFPGDVEIWERGEKKYQIDPSGHIEISLDPAGYDFILKKEGFKDHSLNVFIGEGETVFRSVTMTELPPDFGTVKILTSVPFVDVKRAYIYLGTTDVTGALEIALPPGNHQLVFTKDGYQTKIKTAIVRAGEGTDLTVEMELEEEPPVFFNAWAYTISTTPPGAKIIIDEFFTGKWTTDTIFLEPEAVYQLRLEKSGFLPFETTIVTEPLPGGGGATEQSQTQSSNNPNSSNNPGFKENPFGFDKELNQDMRLFT